MQNLTIDQNPAQPGIFRPSIKPLQLDTVLPGQEVPEAEGEEKDPLAAELPQVDKISEELQQALDQWAVGSLQKVAQKVQQQLTEILLSWEPDPKKSGEENLSELRETVRQHSARLASQGGSLQMTKAMEDALLSALSKWLEDIMAQLLRLLGPSGSPDALKQLLEKLFRQVSGNAPSGGKTAAQATAILQRASGRQSAAGKVSLPEEGVLYQRGREGVRLDSGYSNQAQRQIREKEFQRPIFSEFAEEKASAPFKKTEAASAVAVSASGKLPVGSSELALARELRFAETVAKSLTSQPQLPTPKELPYVSEERLGLEVGLLWLKGEMAAREPGLSAPTASLIRQATEQRTMNYLYEAGRALQLAARAYPPELCPNLWREDVLRVREELIRRYRLTKDPQRSFLETIAYTVELFEEKQNKEKYRSWLRYLPGRGLFTDQAGWEDIKRGWQNFCESWERFLQDAGIRHGASFREAVGLQSLWALVLPSKKKETGGKFSLWTLTGWLMTAVAAATVIYAMWSAVSVLARAASLAAACGFAGVAVLLLRKSRKR